MSPAQSHASLQDVISLILALDANRVGPRRVPAYEPYFLIAYYAADSVDANGRHLQSTALCLATPQISFHKSKHQLSSQILNLLTQK